MQFDLRDVYSDEDFLTIIKINTSVFLSKVDALYMDQVNFDILASPLFKKNFTTTATTPYHLAAAVVIHSCCVWDISQLRIWKLTMWRIF